MFSVKPGIKYLIIHGLNKGQKIILFKKLKNENINLKEHYGQKFMEREISFLHPRTQI